MYALGTLLATIFFEPEDDYLWDSDEGVTGAMMIRADVKCYYCGYVSGQLEGDPENPRTTWSYNPGPQRSSQSQQNRGAIRYTRCGGPVFLDEIETVRCRSNAPDPRLAERLTARAQLASPQHRRRSYNIPGDSIVVSPTLPNPLAYLATSFVSGKVGPLFLSTGAHFATLRDFLFYLGPAVNLCPSL